VSSWWWPDSSIFMVKSWEKVCCYMKKCLLHLNYCFCCWYKYLNWFCVEFLNDKK
jgi:hypothetical protein